MPGIAGCMSLPASGWGQPLHFLILFIPEEGSKMLLDLHKLPCVSLGAPLTGMHRLWFWNEICKSRMSFVSQKRDVTQQLLCVTVCKVIPFNSWQDMQRRTKRRKGRGMAFGKWNDGLHQNKLFLVWLGPDPRVRLSVRSDNCCSGDSPDGRGREKWPLENSLFWNNW